MTWPTLIRYYFYLKFDRKSRDWIYEYWRQTHTKRKTNPLPFRNYQKHQYWWISLFTVDVQTSIPSKHKYRGQRRKNRIYLVPWTPKLPLPRGQTPGLYLPMSLTYRNGLRMSKIVEASGSDAIKNFGATQNESRYMFTVILALIYSVILRWKWSQMHLYFTDDTPPKCLIHKISQNAA